MTRIIPALFHDFCAAQGITAEDFKECDQWVEISDGEEVVLSGIYWYQAEWNDGAKRQGKKDTSRLPLSATEWIIERPQ